MGQFSISQVFGIALGHRPRLQLLTPVATERAVANTAGKQTEILNLASMKTVDHRTPLTHTYAL